MTEQERFMYQILGKITGSNAPIVFKGALITKLILAENGYVDLGRATTDIDADWIGEPPSMESLTGMINQSLGDFQNKLYAAASREYTARQTAGISIIDKATNKEVIAMDIGMRPIIGSKDYYYGEIRIRGVLINQILSDKIVVLSSDRLFRRAKDIVDVYALSHCTKVKTMEIFDTCEKIGREIKAFDAFHARKNEVEHAYNKLKNIDGKPHFDDIYNYLDKFLRPFVEKDMTAKIWDSDTLKWHDEQEREGDVMRSKTKKNRDER